jgi:hypothetical protein
VRVAAAEASAAAAKSAATEAGMRATRAEERLAATQAQLEEQLAAVAEAQVGACCGPGAVTAESRMLGCMASVLCSALFLSLACALTL